MEVVKLSSQEWKAFGTEAHLICFNEHFPAEQNRIDFALLVHENNVPLAYGTCREFDAHTVYFQFGGAFPSAKNTVKSFKAYLKILEAASSHYKRATTLIENTNIPMLKFAMKAGFLITGVRNFKGSILLEHLLEWEV
jgi:hypothetical protein